jgi:hypothetical protein
VRRKRRHPLRAWSFRRLSCLAAIEQDLPLLTPPDEMAAAQYLSDSTPTMSVQGGNISRRNAGVKNSHPLVFEQQLMMGRRSRERVERIWPRPRFQIRRKRILTHADLAFRLSSILSKLHHRRLKRALRQLLERQRPQLRGQTFNPPRAGVACLAQAWQTISRREAVTRRRYPTRL